MSRIGKKPVVIPAGVECSIAQGQVMVKGPKGSLPLTLHPSVKVELIEAAGVTTAVVTVARPDNVKERSLWGTTRANLQNMIDGVTKGFSQALEVVGVGYRVNLQGDKVVLDVGFSHAVDFPLPAGISAAVDKNVLTLTGIDKHLVGETAARIRLIKKPEPYGGKGIKYVDEVIRRKVGKAAKTAE